MATRTLDSPPSILPLYARAAAPMIPGASLLPFVPGGGGEIPELELELDGVRADPAAVAAYAKVCGFALRDHLPPTYPHVLAFPLHMAVMADGSFPFGAVGLVHIENWITQHRRIGIDEELPLAVRPTGAAAAPQGPHLRPRHRGPGRRRDGLGERPARCCAAAAARGRREVCGDRLSMAGAETSRSAPSGASAMTSAAATRRSPATATRSTCTR